MKKLFQRKGILVMAALCLLFVWMSAESVYRGYKHHGTGHWNYGGGDREDLWRTVTENQYKRHRYVDATWMLALAVMFGYCTVKSWMIEEGKWPRED